MLPLVGDQSLFFTFRNAGKKGVELDLRNDPDPNACWCWPAVMS